MTLTIAGNGSATEKYQIAIGPSISKGGNCMIASIRMIPAHSPAPGTPATDSPIADKTA